MPSKHLYTTNNPLRPPIRDTNYSTSQWREKSAPFCKNKIEEEVTRVAFLGGKIDDFIDGQENKNTRAKTERDISLLKAFLSYN